MDIDIQNFAEVGHSSDNDKYGVVFSTIYIFQGGVGIDKKNLFIAPNTVE